MRSIKMMGPRRVLATTLLVAGLFTGGGIAAVTGHHSLANGGRAHPHGPKNAPTPGIIGISP